MTDSTISGVTHAFKFKLGPGCHMRTSNLKHSGERTHCKAVPDAQTVAHTVAQTVAQTVATGVAQTVAAYYELHHHVTATV